MPWMEFKNYRLWSINGVFNTFPFPAVALESCRPCCSEFNKLGLWFSFSATTLLLLFGDWLITKTLVKNMSLEYNGRLRMSGTPSSSLPSYPVLCLYFLLSLKQLIISASGLVWPMSCMHGSFCQKSPEGLEWGLCKWGEKHVWINA